MGRGQFRCSSPLVLALAVSVLAACPVPGNYTTAKSAPVTGRIVWEDGTPANDIAVLVATDWARKLCGKVALQTRTNTAGAFELAGLTQHSKVFWFIPNLDIAAPRFDVCVSVHDTVRHVYTGIGSLSASAAPDSLTCIAWRFEQSPRAGCNGRAMQAFVSGGHWGDGTRAGQTGFYRLLLTKEPTQVKGYKKKYPQDRPYVYVQWVVPLVGADSGQARFRVDTTVSLPIDRNRVNSIKRLQLWRREGQWMASLEGYKKTFMDAYARAELIFSLGAPGEATLVSGP